MKRDVKQFRDFCRSKELDEVRHAKFALFIEDKKNTGEGGSGNRRGDFTWAELEEAYVEFRELG